MAARIEKELGLSSEIKPGSTGQYDVLYKGELVASKQKPSLFMRLLGDGGFPDETKTVEEIRGKLGPS